MYFLKDITREVRPLQAAFRKQKRTVRLMAVSLFSCLAALLQAAGGFLSVLGYAVSPLATAPVFICAVLSRPAGLAAYVLTCLLLFVIQPAELMIFPFTTGLLAVALGLAVHFFRKRLAVAAAGAFGLTCGIAGLLYIFRFPVLGPFVSVNFSVAASGGIFLFCFCYSWIWLEAGLLLVKRLRGGGSFLPGN